MTDDPESRTPVVDLAFHWSPTSRRKGILRRGLMPGSRSRDGQWRPPFVCFSRDPAYGIASSGAQTAVDESMDLWQLDLTAVNLPREEFDWHDEMRFYVCIPARFLTLLATRAVDDSKGPQQAAGASRGRKAPSRD